MKKTFRIIFLRLFAIIAFAGIMFACANIGNPNGGPYDETPPKFVGSKPGPNQLNYKGGKIEVYFDEYVSVDKPSENVIVSPPQKQAPIIMSLGKKVSVELKDSLLENTTYSIDFTSSIADITEKNVLKNFSYAFSTGDVIDTLSISGMVTNAENNEPMQNIFVGIHNNLSDTAFTTIPFLRTSKTNDRGQFTIHNMAPGSYHVFALEDKNRNYAYDKSSNEAIAFLDTIIIPFAERKMVSDTLWRDTVTVDTVLLVEKTLFHPQDLHLWSFIDSVSPRQRFIRAERPQDYIFTLSFNAPMDTFPKPVPLNFEPADEMWNIAQKGNASEQGFLINYWILDSMIYNIDTLKIEASYWKNNDSIPEIMELRTDTFNLVNREKAQLKRAEAKQKKPVNIRKSEDNKKDSISEEEPPPAVPLQLNITPSGTINTFDIIKIAFNEPVLDVRKEFFVMEKAIDTLWQSVEFEFEKDSTQEMIYYIKRPFKYNETYRITVDSVMLCGVYGHCNKALTVNLTVKSDREYGSLSVYLQGLPMISDSTEVIPPMDSTEMILTVDSNPKVMPVIAELLDSNGSPVRKVIVENGIARFIDMIPDKYFFRVILDENGNGKWDAGSYDEKRQPERVVYYDKMYEIRNNVESKEDWDITNSPPGAKPVELLKNKPKEELNKKRDYKEESRPRNTNSTSTNMRGLGGLTR